MNIDSNIERQEMDKNILIQYIVNYYYNNTGLEIGWCRLNFSMYLLYLYYEMFKITGDIIDRECTELFALNFKMTHMYPSDESIYYSLDEYDERSPVSPDNTVFLISDELKKFLDGVLGHLDNLSDFALLHAIVRPTSIKSLKNEDIIDREVVKSALLEIMNR